MIPDLGLTLRNEIMNSYTSGSRRKRFYFVLSALLSGLIGILFIIEVVCRVCISEKDFRHQQVRRERECFADKSKPVLDFVG